MLGPGNIIFVASRTELLLWTQSYLALSAWPDTSSLTLVGIVAPDNVYCVAIAL